MILYCIRHGESAFNAEGRIQGHLEVPLSDLGRRQATAIAAALADAPIEAVYSSTLLRALQTAEPLAASHGLTVRADPRLMEINAGLFQGKLRSELGAIFPVEFAQWMSGDVDFTIPGGESRRALTERGREAFAEIARCAWTCAAVVSHGGLLTSTLQAILDGPPQLSPFALENGSISRIELTPQGVRLLAINEIDHLRDIGLSGGGDL